jgi:hypothetical protein
MEDAAACSRPRGAVVAAMGHFSWGVRKHAFSGRAATPVRIACFARILRVDGPGRSNHGTPPRSRPGLTEFDEPCGGSTRSGARTRSAPRAGSHAGRRRPGRARGERGRGARRAPRRQAGTSPSTSRVDLDLETVIRPTSQRGVEEVDQTERPVPLAPGLENRRAGRDQPERRADDPGAGDLGEEAVVDAAGEELRPGPGEVGDAAPARVGDRVEEPVSSTSPRLERACRGPGLLRWQSLGHFDHGPQVDAWVILEINIGAAPSRR